MDFVLQESFRESEETMKRKKEIAEILRKNGKPIIISIAIPLFRFSRILSISHLHLSKLSVGEVLGAVLGGKKIISNK